MKRIPVLVASIVVALAGLTAGAGSPAGAAPGTTEAVTVAGAHAPDVVLVRFSPDATPAQRDAVRRALGSPAHRSVSPHERDLETIRLPQGTPVGTALARVSGMRGVISAEPDTLFSAQATSNDPRYTSGAQWGMEGMTAAPKNSYGSRAADAWAAGYTGTNDVYVGVLDTGLDFRHPDLAGNLWVNPFDAPDGIDNDGNGYVDDTRGWNFVDDNNAIYDPGTEEHATHVAGIIGARGGNARGVAGVNWNVTMIPAKFLGVGGGTASSAVAAIDYYIDLKVRHGLNIAAINASWGGYGYSQALADAIDRAGDAGILFVAAAGNYAANLDTEKLYPAAMRCNKANARPFDCIVSVASIDANGALSDFSNYGRTTVDLGAPGGEILSTLPNKAYGERSGTSMAAPHVTGAIAACAAVNPWMSAGQMRDALTASVLATTSLSAKTATGGRLSVRGVVRQCANAVPAAAVSGAAPVATATATGSTTATVAWTSALASVTSFEVQRADAPGGVCGTYRRLALVPRDTTTFADDTLDPGSKYCYRVRGGNAKAGGTTSAWSAPTQATTDPESANYTCATTTYSWFDAVAKGRRLPTDYGASVRTALPFAFRYYGRNVSSLVVSRYGTLTLDAAGSDVYANTDIPSSAAPKGMIAPHWDILLHETASAGSGIYTRAFGTAPNRTFVVEWRNVFQYGATGPITFEVLISEATGAITFQYQDLSTGVGEIDNGGSATIGLTSPSGDQGTKVGFNQKVVSANTAVRCTN